MAMSNFVITIGREFGSNGKKIGEEVAKRLGIKCYDKELLSLAAKDSGFCEEILESNDEKPTRSFFIFFGYGYLFHESLFYSTVFGYAFKSESLFSTI